MPWKISSVARSLNRLTVTLEDVTCAGPVVDAGLEAGAHQLQGSHFRVANDLPLRLEALKAAVAEAHAKARAIARQPGEPDGARPQGAPGPGQRPRAPRLPSADGPNARPDPVCLTG
jgi:hypothetical protein